MSSPGVCCPGVGEHPDVRRNAKTRSTFADHDRENDVVNDCDMAMTYQIVGDAPLGLSFALDI